MLYLSDIIGRPVVDAQGNTVARIRDLVAEVVVTPEADIETVEQVATAIELDDEGEPVERDVPVIKGLLAQTSRKGEPFFLSLAQIIRFGPEGVRLRSARVDLTPSERREGEIFVARDLWDKQIIDLNRRRVVRVNDVVISSATANPELARWWVRGIDTGLGALIRRLHLERAARTINKNILKPSVVRWQHIDMFGSNVPGGVPMQHKKLSKLHPVEIARITDAVSYHQGAEIIASLDDMLAADALEEISADRQTDIVDYMPEERAADILEEMAPDEATDLLAELPEEKAGALLEEMDKEEAEEVRRLMRYPENSAGGIMTTDLVRVTPDMTVSEVIEANRPVFLSADLIYYMYVVADTKKNELVGVITVRDLLVHKPEREVHDFMLTDFIAVGPDESRREVARKIAEYNLLALPVVDKNDCLIGVVTVDDALDALLPEGWKKRLPRIFS